MQRKYWGYKEDRCFLSLCANENTDNVTVYSCKDEFVKVSEVSVEKPLCVV